MNNNHIPVMLEEVKSFIPIHKKKEYTIDDIKLGINLFYSVGKIYNLDSEKILNIYKELS